MGHLTTNIKLRVDDDLRYVFDELARRSDRSVGVRDAPLATSAPGVRADHRGARPGRGGSMDHGKRVAVHSPRRDPCEGQLEERDRQDAKWGGVPGVDRRDDHTYAAVLGEEFGECSKAWLERNTASLREELVQVAAVAVAWIEELQTAADPGLVPKPSRSTRPKPRWDARPIRWGASVSGSGQRTSLRVPSCARCGRRLPDPDRRVYSTWTRVYYCSAVDACGRRAKRKNAL